MFCVEQERSVVVKRLIIIPIMIIIININLFFTHRDTLVSRTTQIKEAFNDYSIIININLFFTHRDTLVSRTTQIKEGLNCFFCLVPYDIITFEVGSTTYRALVLFN